MICAYTADRSAMLEAAVASALEQRLPPLEVIVVCDQAPELAAWARRRLDRAIVLENELAPGLSGARNTGLLAASGELVGFLDDDAVAAPDWLERLAAQFADADVVGAGGAILPAWQESRPAWLPPEFDWVIGCSYRGLPVGRSDVRNVIGASMLLRRDAVTAIGGFVSGIGRQGANGHGCEETELCLRLTDALPRARIVYDPEAVVHHAVPADRTNVRYFLRRCYAEGISKARVTRRAGRERGLASERHHAARVLPAGIAHAIRAGAWSRAAAIVAGLLVTSSGYVVGSAR